MWMLPQPTNHQQVPLAHTWDDHVLIFVSTELLPVYGKGVASVYAGATCQSDTNAMHR